MPDDFDYAAPPRRSVLSDISSRPWLTQTLCVLCVIITLAFWTSNKMPGTLWYTIGHFGLQDADAIWDGHYYGLLTSFFTHLDIMHILFNMLWLWQLGALVETSIPRWKYVLFLLGAGVVGSCCEIAVSGQTGAGASGVVYAIFGLLWAGRGAFTSWRAVATRHNLNLFVGWGILCIFLTYSGIMPIGNGAHWGGFLYGLAIGWLCYAPRRRPIWGVVLALLAAVCVMAFTWMPWSLSWNWYRGNKEFERKHFRQAIDYYQRGLRLNSSATDLWKNIALAWQSISLEAVSRNDAKAANYAYQQAAAAEQHVAAAPPPKEADRSDDGSAGEPQQRFIRPGGQK
jgi:GlpG protein